MKVYTRRGDAGETDLFGGARVPKDHLRVEAYGTLDELNAALGAAAAASRQPDLCALAREIQSALFHLGAAVATADEKRRASGVREPDDDDVKHLESQIDRLDAELEPLRRFVLPGGTPAAAAFHVARTICRRAERRAVALERAEPRGGAGLRYLNRLSDLLFVMARIENRRADVPDVEWQGLGR